MGRFHGGFLIWDDLEKIGGRKMSENAKNQAFLGKNPWVTGTGAAGSSGIGTDWQWVTGTSTDHSGTGTTTSSSPVFAYFASLSPVFIYRCLGTLRNE